MSMIVAVLQKRTEIVTTTASSFGNEGFMLPLVMSCPGKSDVGTNLVAPDFCVFRQYFHSDDIADKMATYSEPEKVCQFKTRTLRLEAGQSGTVDYCLASWVRFFILFVHFFPFPLFRKNSLFSWYWIVHIRLQVAFFISRDPCLTKVYSNRTTAAKWAFDHSESIVRSEKDPHRAKIDSRPRSTNSCHIFLRTILFITSSISRYLNSSLGSSIFFLRIQIDLFFFVLLVQNCARRRYESKETVEQLLKITYIMCPQVAPSALPALARCIAQWLTLKYHPLLLFLLVQSTKIW